jgi:hypothetical protein
MPFISEVGAQGLPATPTTPNLLDIYPGMPEQAARVQLQKHSATTQITSQSGTQLGFQLSVTNTKNPEQITVHVTAPPNNPTVWMIERQQTFERQNPMSQQALMSALRDKYGPENLSQPRAGWLYVFWVFDANGKRLASLDPALTACVGSDYLLNNVNGLPHVVSDKAQGCYHSFFGVVAMLNRSGPDLLEAYDVQLVNLPYAYQAALNTTNARDKAANRATQEQLQRANQNKPAF